MVYLRLPDPGANHQLHQRVTQLGLDSSVEQNDVIPFIDKGIRKTALCYPWRSNPAQLDWLSQQACCIVFILSPSAESPAVDRLQAMFGFSRAEVRVLNQLLDGHAVKEIADLIFISEATVRFHIRNLLRKTESHSQAELISKIFTSTSALIN